jgi:ASC-1-like (ASCH) protein
MRELEGFRCPGLGWERGLGVGRETKGKKKTKDNLHEILSRTLSKGYTLPTIIVLMRLRLTLPVLLFPPIAALLQNLPLIRSIMSTRNIMNDIQRSKSPVPIVNPLVRLLQQQSSLQSAISEHKALALQLKESRNLPRNCRTMPLKQQYLNFILQGSKTIEGRVNTGMPAYTRVNDYFLFFNHDSTCMTQIMEKKSFPTFKEMLQHYTIKSCLPDFKGDLDAAEKLYRSFPGYAEKEARHGVVGMKLRLLDTTEMREMLKDSTNEELRNEGGRKRSRDVSPGPELRSEHRYGQDGSAYDCGDNAYYSKRSREESRGSYYGYAPPRATVTASTTSSSASPTVVQPAEKNEIADKKRPVD